MSRLRKREIPRRAARLGMTKLKGFILLVRPVEFQLQAKSDRLKSMLPPGEGAKLVARLQHA